MLKPLKWVGFALALAVVPVLATDDVARAQNVAAPVFVQHGVASWYGPGFHGRRTASGERFNQYAMTAAHKRLPMGTRVTVTNLRNGRTIEVEINDRGPFIRGRILDLSKGAAERLGMKHAGTTPIRLEVHEENWVTRGGRSS
jgi:rare lipoprotein A